MINGANFDALEWGTNVALGVPLALGAWVMVSTVAIAAGGERFRDFTATIMAIFSVVTVVAGVFYIGWFIRSIWIGEWGRAITVLLLMLLSGLAMAVFCGLGALIGGILSIPFALIRRVIRWVTPKRR